MIHKLENPSQLDERFHLKTKSNQTQDSDDDDDDESYKSRSKSVNMRYYGETDDDIFSGDKCAADKTPKG